MGVIGIDIGGTSFRIGLVDDRGEVTDFRKVPVKQVFTTEKPLEDLCTYLKAYIQERAVEALAIGFPATLDAKRQTVLQAPNIPFMEHLPVVEVLSRELGIPVYIERDVTFGLMYDCKKYKVAETGIVCGFYFGTGIGNAIAINGQPLIGRNGTAGELGHIPADGSSEVCGCGNVGCLEPLAGGRYLAQLCRETYTDTHISEIFAKHGDAPEIKRFIDRMAIAVATEINILDPDVVLLGGGVANMPGFPRDYLNSRILERTRKPLPAENLTILYTEDEPEKSVVGAAIYARSKR